MKSLCGRTAILASLLTIALVVLKLSGTVAWSWLWIMSPMWITVLLVLITMAVIWIAFKFWENKILPKMITRIKPKR